MRRIGGKDGPYGKQPQKSVASLSGWLPASMEAYFALNERWFIGSRQVQKIVKRVASRSGVGSKSWIEPFRGDPQKTSLTEYRAVVVSTRLTM
jgi:hypothetical protein